MPVCSLRKQNPNLMLRILRAMRLLQIQSTVWRVRYIRLYCASRILNPAGLAYGACPRKHCQVMTQELLHDDSHFEVATGVSQRLRTLTEELQRKLIQHSVQDMRL
jgi:hypothetical protein